jgi:ubiquinone/menaquinone biosynthesis C-methylase UbiE
MTNKKVILDIGCGDNKIDDAVGIDIVDLEPVDILASADAQYLPFQEDSVDKIYCNHVIEHLDDVVSFIEELCRTVRSGGEIVIRTPHFTSYGAYTDPTHKQFFGYYSFDYFCSREEAADIAFPWYTDAHITILHRYITFPKSIQKWNYIIEVIANLYPQLYEMSPLRLFPAGEIYYHMEVKE